MESYLENPQYLALRRLVEQLLRESDCSPDEVAEQLIILDEVHVDNDGDFEDTHGTAMGILEQWNIDSERLDCLQARTDAGLLEFKDIPVTTEPGIWASLAIALPTFTLPLLFGWRLQLLMMGTPHFSLPKIIGGSTEGDGE